MLSSFVLIYQHASGFNYSGYGINAQLMDQGRMFYPLEPIPRISSQGIISSDSTILYRMALRLARFSHACIENLDLYLAIFSALIIPFRAKKTDNWLFSSLFSLLGKESVCSKGDIWDMERRLVQRCPNKTHNQGTRSKTLPAPCFLLFLPFLALHNSFHPETQYFFSFLSTFHVEKRLVYRLYSNFKKEYIEKD